jgi:hypothetical protein
MTSFTNKKPDRGRSVLGWDQLRGIQFQEKLRKIAYSIGRKSSPSPFSSQREIVPVPFFSDSVESRGEIDESAVEKRSPSRMALPEALKLDLVER